ncbi:type IV pilus modification protein PilV [Methylophaga sp.]|uniref:type IV pilus modification protein PilV n=1 Tax=Methylophaga sp. TaxID=2024840 RepID=UPI0013FEA8BE|nr:type IV pilus modification protein PilV [Methylophaga sp.]MTI63735.1 type IV pilus modification protein PilV [Methylophaga sp.]
MSVEHEQGFTLVEVMVAVLVLAIGLLGMAHLHVTSMKVNQSAEFRSQATTLAANMFDRMRANQQAAKNGDYALTLNTDPPASPSNVAENDIAEWLTKLNNTLPQGDASIVCPAFAATTEFVCDITITWTEMQENDALGTTSYVYAGAIL